MLTYLVREVRVIASPLMAPSLSNVTELLINMKMAAKSREIDALSKNATHTRRIQSNTELHVRYHNIQYRTIAVKKKR